MSLERMNLSQHGPLEQSFDPAEFGRIKAEAFNKEKGKLTGYDCPVCLNRGQIAVPNPSGGAPSFKECECMKIRRCVQKMESSGMREALKICTFDTYTASESWQKTIKQGAEQYAEDPTGWLLFCGQSGCGKTHLCTAVCSRLLMDGFEVIYMPWHEEVAYIKGLSTDGEKRNQCIKKYQQAQVAFIDDLFKIGRSADGSNRPTAADIGNALDILNYRYINRLPTIISTERTPAELIEIDEALGGRIVEMAQGNTYLIEKKEGRNYRLRGVVTV